MRDRDDVTVLRGGRSPSPHRARAAGLLVLIVGGTVAGAGLLAALQRPGSAAPPTPFAPGPLVGATLEEGRRALPEDSAYTLLYVSVHCPFCRAELAAWRERLARDPELAAPVVVIGRDASADEAATFVAGLPGAVLLDAGGDIGRALGVTMVPYTARFDRTGTVVQVVVGLTGGRGPTRKRGTESTTRAGGEPW